MKTEEILAQVNSLRREFDNYGNHVKYDSNGDILYYKTDNFEYPSFKSIDSPQEQDFIDIVKDGIIKIDKTNYRNSVFLFKNEKYLFEYNLNFGYISFNYVLIWSVFQRKYSMNDEQIRVFLKDMMEKHFNCKDVTPKKRF